MGFCISNFENEKVMYESKNISKNILRTFLRTFFKM